VLGFIPGVGAFYNGQFAKGFVHVFVFAILCHLADRADWFGWLIPAWIFYMVFDAYTTAKARMLGQPLPDHLGLNALLGGFGLGTSAHHHPVAAAAAAGAAPAAPVGGVASGSPEINPGVADPNVTAAQPPNQPYVEDPMNLSRSCGPMGLPLGAVILIALGVLLLLDNLGILSFRWTTEFWPIVLIILGVWLAMRRMGTTHGGS
jgi:TM2 domain-containing membrane protein YozV